ncbi:flagellar hook-associated protein FlgL [Photobacterium sp. WH77]|uniref:Flagellar hook-associated protein FlgL n=1 Tax=Photobacterium arenosum TaxID=2774143 RepID=A0ABR9BH21_9GAMM|nr:MULTISPECIES: flagellar hook-associated protein FlgL [Photobacterium]MBD8511844.1 flagellar hook-associated protein FlgL [Photobacterium arenosum]MBV7261452.1 flagellar hook-associated protein FlgL [Photobacterium sp. WH24]MCG2836920.1 flagellar hook-associated protein FlgL [Photobacterium sp. WH77]MCG2844471.1 flagellar hook-associated protein FlgL [Photobacterium sp. WH80]MDO6581681.1 flagellar hook-associated protein FlgL [Photobacterium sp. 2_MG-2023]
MISRIASFHNYQSVANDMNRQQVKVADNQEQLASGKQLLTAGDDPVASIYVQNFSQQNTEIDQSLRSITLARNRLNSEETAISDAETLLDDAKRKTMSMVNGSLSDDDRIAHMQDLRGLFDSVIHLVNTQDESGNFVFAGNQYDKQPFFRDGNGNVSYVGDSYQRMSKVSPNVEVPVNDPGDKLFMNIENPYGDYQPDYDLQSGSLLLLSHARNNNHSDNASYTIDFTQTGSGAVYDLYQDGLLVDSQPFDPKRGIEWGTLSVQLEGEVTDGDQITLSRQDTFSLFDSFKRGIEVSARAPSDASATAELHQVAEEFSQAFKHINRARSEVGTRLQTLDRQADMHEDFKLVINKARGTLEDLDYGKAVVELNENMLALQASQQAFAKTKNLSLFNYI